ncbi:unnamed protein product [Linum tenue]|uniref:Protein kinase domain-containing protein n=2 Tax=Linum tenue TaxID=586396 RepID=A0AAV0Q552_9ROSI|nr:unnamed protein product [Linum tenue]
MAAIGLPGEDDALGIEEAGKSFKIWKNLQRELQRQLERLFFFCRSGDSKSDEKKSASKSKIYIAMELVRGGELFSKVARGRLREDAARVYFQQLISAIDFCHSCGVYHQDLNPENLLLLPFQDDNLVAMYRKIYRGSNVRRGFPPSPAASSPSSSTPIRRAESPSRRSWSRPGSENPSPKLNAFHIISLSEGWQQKRGLREFTVQTKFPTRRLRYFGRAGGGFVSPPPSKKRRRSLKSKIKVEALEDMVAISLYRGNLHRVPDAPRRWLMPSRNLSLRDFKSLLNRRSRALSHLRSPSTVLVAAGTTSNPNPDLTISTKHDSKEAGDPTTPQLKEMKAVDDTNHRGDEEEGPSGRVGEGAEEDRGLLNGGDCSMKLDDAPVENPEAAEKGRVEVVNGDGDLQALLAVKLEESAEPSAEAKDKPELSGEKAKREKEVEEKLEILNAKKHNLVQLLKQLLNGEEELKRRSTVQAMTTRPSGLLQVDVTNDSGSMIRHVTPGMGSEANLGADMEEAENDDVSNQNVHSRYLQRMSSISPSSESPLRRPPYNVVPPLPPRTSLGASPSRFAPTGQQNHPTNAPPTVSISGTNYTPSSPSPLASGGTSAFRDARQPSPWN